MPLLEAIQFLKGAIDRSSSSPTYVFHDGVMYARSPAIAAAFPVPHILGTFALPAEDLERALGRMKTEPTITAGEGSLILRSGRLRSEITLLAADPPTTDPSSVEGWEPVPERLFPALRLAKEFVPSDGGWQRSVRFENNRILAVSNRGAIEVAVPSLVSDGVAMTDDCVDYLTGIRIPPAEMVITGGAAWFRWQSGAWVRCQLLALDWPDRIFEILMERIGEQETPVALTQDWRDAFDHAVALCDDSGGHGVVTIRATGLHVKSSQGAQHFAEIETGMQRETFWSVQTLRPMFAEGVATAWNPDANGPAIFVGNGVRGIVMGRRS